ncbi:MAG: hypothetical protein PHI31_02350 [Desulfuromonadaceae bacterium]|nr:hypothetical protein [Desulfuromonadaceae bacterium]
MSDIVTLATQWLTADKTTPKSSTTSNYHIIESLLAEIQRLEFSHARAAEEVEKLKTEGTGDLRRAVAEECAVICETADYVVRSYGCAHEIRKKFGIPMPKR